MLPDLGVLVDELPVQALAVARVRAATTATVPHLATLFLAHVLLVVFVLRLTCSYLLKKERFLAEECLPHPRALS